MNWLIDHFTQDFIESQRYMYIVNGLKNTLIITVFAALLGIALGFVLAIIRSSHDKSDKPGIVLRILNFIAKVYLTVIRGTPVLVQVMIWYFGVFTSPNTVKIMVIILASVLIRAPMWQRRSGPGSCPWISGRQRPAVHWD